MDGAIEQDAYRCQQQTATENHRKSDCLQIFHIIDIPPCVSHQVTRHQESHEETQRHNETDAQQRAHKHRDDAYKDVPSRSAIRLLLLCPNSLLHLRCQVLRIHLLTLHLQHILCRLSGRREDGNQQIGKCRKENERQNKDGKHKSANGTPKANP